MSDKDFDKIFGDKLREERAFSSVDNDWEKLTTRLDANVQNKEKDNRRRGAWLWLLLIPILSLLLWQMNDLKNQNKQLGQQLEEVQAQFNAYKMGQSVQSQQALKTDTIIIYQYLPAPKVNNNKKFNSKSENLNQNIPSSSEGVPLGKESIRTIKTDFLVKIPRVSDKSNTLSAQNTPNLQDTIIPKPSDVDKKTTELLDKLAALEKQMLVLQQTLNDNKANAASLADCVTRQDSLAQQLLAMSALVDSLKKNVLSERSPLDSNPPQKSDKLLSKGLLSEKNNRLFVGLQGGPISYRTTWKNSYGIDVFKDIKSYQLGLKLEYALTDKLRLTAEGDFCPFSFTNYWQDSRYNLPDMHFDAQKEKFLKAESSQSLLQGNIGVKYLFTEGVAKWRPYVSAAYTMMRIQPFETKFTYQSLWGTINREQLEASKAVNVSNLMLMSGGFEYRFSKHWVAQAEAFYYKDVNKTHKTFDLFGIRAAVLLNLK